MTVPQPSIQDCKLHRCSTRAILAVRAQNVIDLGPTGAPAHVLGVAPREFWQSVWWELTGFEMH